MSLYHHEWFIKYIGNLLHSNVTPATWGWLNDNVNKFTLENGAIALFTSFTAIPRYTGKGILTLSKEDKIIYTRNSQGFSIFGHTVDRLARVWLLVNWPSENKARYLKGISELFKAAEVNEQIALYGALPLLCYPEDWIKQCVGGIRGNIGTVLEVIMCDNSYPAKYLDEPAWNQLVLKAFFTEKPVQHIIGLDSRANKQLAYTLCDYAYERWAAKRTINPQLWRLVGKFIDDRTFPAIQKAFKEGSAREKEAVVLACAENDFAPAIALFNDERA